MADAVDEGRRADVLAAYAARLAAMAVTAPVESWPPYQAPAPRPQVARAVPAAARPAGGRSKAAAEKPEAKLRERVRDLQRRLRRTELELRSQLIVARADPRRTITPEALRTGAAFDEMREALAREIARYDAVIAIWD